MNLEQRPPSSAKGVARFMAGGKMAPWHEMRNGARPRLGTHMNKLLVGGLAAVIAAGVCRAATDPADTYSDLHLIPWPERLQVGTGYMPLTGDSRIVTGQEQRRPLAEVLSGEIALLTARRAICNCTSPTTKDAHKPAGEYTAATENWIEGKGRVVIRP